MTDDAVMLERRPFLATVDLRLDPALAGRLPFPLPPPGTAWEEGSRAVLWLGPDEWLIVGPPDAGANIVTELERSLSGVHLSIVDVSASRVVFELRGPGAKELLSTGCSLDLHPRSWTVGSCAQTMLAKAPVILHERERTTRILVRASFADYLMSWLLASLPEVLGAHPRHAGALD